MEIERKYLVDTNNLAHQISNMAHFHIKQGYISSLPVLRIRQKNDLYYFTFKGEGLMCREEFETRISKEAFQHLLTKLERPLISKTRYIIPYQDYQIELDVFHDQLEGLILAEVEFDSIDKCNTFIPPSWFIQDVTQDPFYQNVNLSQLTLYNPQ